MSIHKTLIAQVLFLTLGFGLAYGIIRSVPVKSCDIMHYGQFMNEAGEVEYCGAGEPEFFDMTQLRYPVTVRLDAGGSVRAGQAAAFLLDLRDYQQTPLSAEDIAVSHTERIHLMAVDPSLSDYQHLHPAATGAPGQYRFELTPRYSGRYAIYLDFIPLRGGRRVLLATDFEAAGEAAAPSFDSGGAPAGGGLRFTLEGAEQPVAAGEAAFLRLRVETSDGRPAVLGPVMGAWGHLVAFDPARSGFAHLHPLTPYIAGQTLRPPEALDFSFLPDRPGKYRLWAQVNVDGQDRFAPFDVKVRR